MALRIRVSATRIILDLLKQFGPMSRAQMWENSDRAAIPSKRKLTQAARYLHQNNRINTYLPKGKLRGIDPFIFRLNPQKERINFPYLYQKQKGCTKEKELQQLIKEAYGEAAPAKATEQPIKSAIKEEGESFFDPTKM